MIKRKVVLTFPQNLLDKTITYRLIKDYDLIINILKANITPKEQGVLVLEIEGKKQKLESGLDYLRDSGITVQALINDIKWQQKKCIHCTECVTVCPTGAFAVNRQTMQVEFNKKKCIACGLCINVCPYRAIEIVI
ncbi:MAG: (Fe-S)-binding protein [Candidatus Omnitrophota bacterium]|nr:MAG: (Fe-S)-binding protein [Candidatus Omnitrophota bacterium]